jgi:N-acetylneuraminic acid mutarotase
MWIYGSHRELFKYNFEKNEWKGIEKKGKSPVKRSNTSMILIENKILIFGGSDDENNELNDLYSFNVDTFEWKQLPSSPYGNRSGNKYK